MERPKPSVLLISGGGDGDQLAQLIEQNRVVLSRAASLESVREKLNKTLFDVVVLHLDHGEALLELPRLSELCPDTPIVVSGADEAMHQALLAGATEFLSWPASPAALNQALESALARIHADGSAEPQAGLEALLGKSEQMLKVKNTLKDDGSEMPVQLKFSNMDDFTPEKYKDTVRERVMETIQRKIEGQDITAEATPETGGKILDLMEALKASLAATSESDKAAKSA